MSRRQRWVCAVLCAGFAVLQMNETLAVARDGLLARMKSGDRGCLFSCGQRSDLTIASEAADGEVQGHSPSEPDEVTAQPEVTGDDQLAEGTKRKGGVFARMRSKRGSKEVTTDAQDLMEQSSSDLPVETIPPAPGS